MIRGALWLLQVVGEGNTFTKNELREAFPGVAQVDRRIRDLRDFEWVVHTSNEDASLLAEDQRFVKAGVEVWDARARRLAAPQKAVPARERQAVLMRDGYMCTLCGIAGGEPYPDDSVLTAVLAVSRRPVTGADGQEETALVTECKRCRSGGAPAPLGVEDILARAGDLDPGERRRLHRWMERGRRGTTDLDRAWAAYLRVPPGQRKEAADQIHRML
ncbi:hypothetical protein [Ornithinimicrobium sp. W1679]|uniref:hypothetical protein n=1 Tax=Ornithinimicrobium sp. W1679 TaxID=3418770 RepID=UPI003CF44A38